MAIKRNILQYGKMFESEKYLYGKGSDKINVFFLQKDGESFYLAQFYLSGLPLNIIYCLITREVIDHAGRM